MSKADRTKIDLFAASKREAEEAMVHQEAELRLEDARRAFLEARGWEMGAPGSWRKDGGEWLPPFQACLNQLAEEES